MTKEERKQLEAELASGELILTALKDSTAMVSNRLVDIRRMLTTHDRQIDTERMIEWFKKLDGELVSIVGEFVDITNEAQLVDYWIQFVKPLEVANEDTA